MNFHPNIQLFQFAGAGDRTTDPWITKSALYLYTMGDPLASYLYCPFSFLQAEFGQQLKTCDAIIVMYSLTDRISFHVAREILDDLANLGSVVCPVLLLANKMDLCQHRKVNFKKV